jgi:two-component system chemotaxis response regulator CheB
VLSEQQSEYVERSLWTAMTALEEKASLTRRLAKKFMERGDPGTAEIFKARPNDAEEKAAVLRELLMVEEPVTTFKDRV